MPKIKYIDLKLGRSRLAVVDQANAIIAEYASQGFNLTLRQLYYQFVARGFIANSQREYKRLGGVVNDARMAGLVDWNAITDRTRELRSLASWSGPSSIVGAAASQYREDLWAGQRRRVEVWIEKDALVGVVEGVCNELRVPYFSCRGYTSQSEMWVAGRRLLKHAGEQDPTLVIHLGDHDPSGIDMSRDIEDRLALFTGGSYELHRIALNMDQVLARNPPPNPAKTTDSRAASYIQKHGNESWELDALDPAFMAGLIRARVLEEVNAERWQEAKARETSSKENLEAVSERWEEVEELVKERGA